jgi:hypothetical protein
MTLTQVAAMAADAQSKLHVLNVAARAGAEARTINVLRDMHRTRLAVAAELFADTRAVNDTAFQTAPELA